MHETISGFSSNLCVAINDKPQKLLSNFWGSLQSPNMQMIKEMLNKAFTKVKDTKGHIFHSDQGWQYHHYSYRKALEKQDIIQSVSRKGNCLDIALAESLFGILKTEWLYTQSFQTEQDCIASLKEYLDYYNNKRIKNRLKGKSPVEYRALVLKT